MTGDDATGDDATGDVVAFLRERAWPGERPTVIETHLSWVFLTGDRAYKLKKPIRVEFVDARTVEARARDCRAEVALNARLAPGVYLGVRTVRRGTTGDLVLGPDPGGPPTAAAGDVVDWMVEMRRLPAAGLLDRRLASGLPSAGELDGLVRHLAAFYREAVPHPRSAAAHRAVLAHGLARDLAGLGRHAARLADTDDGLTTLHAALLELLGRPEIGRRGAAVVEGHGDLRPEHVLLGPPPLVIDCITYDPALRLVDPYHDLALLVVEADALGATGFGPALLTRYAALTGDDPPPAVTRTACSLRALTRARLSIAHLDDDPPDPGRWITKARRYLGLAHRYAGLSDRTGGATTAEPHPTRTDTPR